MSNYAEKNLQKGEEIVLKAQISIFSAAGRFLFFVICVGIGVAVMIYGRQIAALMAVTSRMPTAMESLTLSECVGVAEHFPIDSDAYHIYSLFSTIATWIGIVIMVLGGLSLLFKILDSLFTDIVITNKRIIGKRGVLRVRSIDIHIDKVDTVNISAPLLGRIFKYYSLSIKGSGTGEPIAFFGVKNANEFKNAINSEIEHHAEVARNAQAAQIASAMNRNNN